MAKLLEQGLDAGRSVCRRHGPSAIAPARASNLGTLRAREPELLALASVLRATGERGLPVPLGQLPHHGRRVRPIRVRPDHRLRPRQPAAGQLHRATGHRGPRAVAGPDGAGRDAAGRRTRRQGAGGAPADRGPLGARGVRQRVHPGPGLRADRRPPHWASASRRCGIPTGADGSSRATPNLTSGPDAFAGYTFFGRFDEMYVLDDPVDYNLDSSRSLGAVGRPSRHRSRASTPTTCSCNAAATSSSTRRCSTSPTATSTPSTR